MERSEAQDRQELPGAEVCKKAQCMQRGPEAGTESPHAAATPMMARVRKPTARCPAVGASTTVVFSVSVWVLVWVSVCSILTWNVPNLL